MQNGYFRLVNRTESYGLAILPPLDGGERVAVSEVEQYLNDLSIPYDRMLLERVIESDKEEFLPLGKGSCPEVSERYRLTVSEDNMSASARFWPASETGNRITLRDFLKDLRFGQITYGIDEELLNRHFMGAGIFCTELVIAKGDQPVQGSDARIEYLFDTELQVHPQTRENGSVDYFHMTTINHCKKGEILARVIPEDPGMDGFDIYGGILKPRPVKTETLKFGRNIILSEDRRSISSEVDGHVSLVDGKVFVSSVYEVKNVDVSTGNLEFDGSIEIGGDVTENFEVKAGGNVVVNGSVEGATIVAGGDIIIAKGMNGMGKGMLRAGGNVIVRFVENATVHAGGYVQTGAILYSKVTAGTEVLVDGRKGLLVGGNVQARLKIDAKNIGAAMGGNTILEVGIESGIKDKCVELEKMLAENNKTVRDGENVLLGFLAKKKQGVQITESQMKYMKTVASLLSDKKKENQELEEEIEALRRRMKPDDGAEIIVRGELFPGTTIIIGEAIETIQSSYHYCRFVRERGQVVMATL